eukprot:1773253-Ditylum_brightwellii.AAC.1
MSVGGAGNGGLGSGPWTQQASDLKETTKGLKLQKKDVTIASSGVVNMYPSTKLQLPQKALKHYSRKLPKKEQDRMNKCIKLISFGIELTLARFKVTYYNHNGVV